MSGVKLSRESLTYFKDLPLLIINQAKYPKNAKGKVMISMNPKMGAKSKILMDLLLKSFISSVVDQKHDKNRLNMAIQGYVKT